MRMSEIGDHIIGSQIFELEFLSGNEKRAADLHHRISHTYEQALKDVIQEVLDLRIPTEEDLSIDKLQLNLPPVRFDHVEEELPSLLRKALLEALDQYDISEPETNENSLPAGNSLFELLEYYLLNGSLPWWSKSGKNLEQLVSEAMEVSTEKLNLLFRKVVVKGYIIKRVVWQLSEDLIQKVIHVLEPTQAELIITYAREIVRSRLRKNIFNADEHQLKLQTWELILTYILVDRGSVFNTKAFLRYNLMQLANYFHISYGDLLEHFFRSLEAVKGDEHSNLLNLIREIHEEDQKKSFESRKPAPQDSRDIFFLKQLLLIEYEQIPKADYDKLLGRLIRNTPDLLNSFMETNLRNPAFQRKMLTYFSVRSRRSLQRILNPGVAELLDGKHGRIEWRRRQKVIGSERREKTLRFLKSFLSSTSSVTVISKAESLELEWLIKNHPKETRRFFSQLDPSQVEIVNFLKLPDLFQRQTREMLVTGSFPKSSVARGVAIEYPVSEKPLQQMMAFLHYAKFKEGSQKEPDELLTYLLKNEPRSLIKELKKSRYPATVAKRLSNEFTVQTLRELITAMAASQSKELLDYMDLFERSPLEGRSRRSLYESTLFFLLQASGQGTSLIYGFIRFTGRRFGWTSSDIKVTKGQISPLINTAKTILNGRKQSEDEWETSTDKLSFQYYMLTGQVPWWTPNKTLISTRMAIREFFFRKPREARSAILEIRRGIDIRKSIIDAFEISSIAHIAAQLEPNHYNFIGTGIQTFARANADTTTGSSTEATAGTKLLWEMAFIYMFQEQSGHFNRKQFTLSLMQQMARRNNLDFRELLNLVITSVEDLDAKSEFAIILKELNEEFGEISHPSASTKTPKYESANNPMVIESLKAYLTNGYLPTWSGISPRKPLEEIWRDAIETYPDHVRDLLLSRKNSAPILNRLAASDERVFIMLSDVLNAQSSGVFVRIWREILEMWRSASPTGLSEKEFSIEFRKSWIHYMLSSTNSPVNYGLFLSRFILSLSRKKNLMPDGILNEWLESGNPTGTVRPFLEMLRKKMSGSSPSDEEIIEEDEEELPASDAPVFIENAGLVLLWSFLPSYFEKLGLLKGGDFADIQMRHRAIYLTEYLVTGQENPPEYHLVLNKLLVGIQTAKPILSDKRLTEEEKSISKSLLDAVIAHWKILGSTSVEGLRQSFLQREGKLTEREDSWELVVEQKPFDMLMDHLPWSINIVKLPWMVKTLYVRWR